MAACIFSGDTTACGLLESCIKLIEATDAKVNAFTDETLSRAFAEADAVDARFANGEALGPLAGVPYAIKNLFDIESLVTLAGLVVYPTHAPAIEDAFLVGQMKAAGAVLVGALNMDETPTASPLMKMTCHRQYRFLTFWWSPTRSPKPDLTTYTRWLAGGGGACEPAGMKA